MMELNIRKEFPFLTFWNNKTYWTGFIKVQNVMLRVALSVPNYPNVKSMLFKGDQKTEHLISELKLTSRLQNVASTDKTLLEFLELFLSMVQESSNGLGENAPISLMAQNPEVQLNVLNDLEVVGIENISYVSNDCKEVRMSQEDPSGRLHEIKLFIPQGYPNREIRVECDLPSTQEPIIWPAKIPAAFMLFSRLLNKFDGFWTEMDDFDGSVQLLDPLHPKRSHCHRRVILNEQVILHFVVNPVSPRNLPYVQFHGPEDPVNVFEANFTRNCKKWNPNCSVLDNLQAIIECEFPIKGDESTVERDTKCVICYAYDLDGHVPETICQCGSFFHDKCIQELYVNELTHNVMKTNAVDCPVCTMRTVMTAFSDYTGDKNQIVAAVF